MSNDSMLPPGWKPAPRKAMQGGQATALPVLHEDGREGVFREIKNPMSEVDQARFRRELGILSGEEQHRAIVKLFDWSADVDPLWYISELGNPFDRWWAKVKKDSVHDPETLVERAVSVLGELAHALAICHERGIIHRDIKPKNLIVKRGVTEPWPILIDFGIAHVADEIRLTPSDQAVGNARFSPDVMRNRLEDVRPWLDVFDLAQLFIWMLDQKAPKDHWQRPVHWRHAVYSDLLTDDIRLSIRAFTATCSNEDTSPVDGSGLTDLLIQLFTRRSAPLKGGIDLGRMIEAKRRGRANKYLRDAEAQDEVEACAPLAQKIYLELRDELLSVLEELSEVEPSAAISFDEPFHYRLIGATDLFSMRVGSPHMGIQLRIKAKIVLRSVTTPANESNRSFWIRHMPNDAICFTFALEGGVAEAHDSRYEDGRWVTIGRDGSVFIHPLNASFGNFGDNDLGGSAEGPGLPASMSDVREFAVSIFEKDTYWEYIASN